MNPPMAWPTFVRRTFRFSPVPNPAIQSAATRNPIKAAIPAPRAVNPIMIAGGARAAAPTATISAISPAVPTPSNIPRKLPINFLRDLPSNPAMAPSLAAPSARRIPIEKPAIPAPSADIPITI